MKTVSALALATVSLLSSVEACWQVHTYWQGDPFGGDVLSIQVRDTDIEVCNGGATIYLANEASEYCLEAGSGCNDGYRVCMTNFGRAGYVENTAVGYRGDLFINADGAQDDTFDCYCKGTSGSCLQCGEFETCLNDNFSNCGQYPYCALCDYRAHC